MNLTALLTEFYARGHTYLNDSGAGTTRATAFINGGYKDLCELEPWPFLETTTTGAAPVTITDLRDIIYVSSVNGQLAGRDVSVFIDDDPLLSSSGVGCYWWLDGLTTLKVWPADTGTSLTVRYLKVPTDLASGSDTPIVPARYHELIVDFAVIRGLRDRSNHAEATLVRQGMEERLDAMRNALLDESDWFQHQTVPSNA